MAVRSRIRWPYVAALVLAIGWGASSSIHRGRVEGEVLAFTECSFRGAPRVVIRPDLAPADTLPVRVHEQVHAEQCRTLGPMRYRLRNLTGTGKLSLEVPAYCAAAQVRLKASRDWAAVHDRMFDDIMAALHGVVDSAQIARTVARECPIMSVRVSHA